jgi:hypothetical protein
LLKEVENAQNLTEIIDLEKTTLETKEMQNVF